VRAYKTLSEQGYSPFLPMCIKPGESITRPLFPRYLFIEITTKPWGALDPNRPVGELLRVTDKPAIVPASVIVELQMRVNEGNGAVILEDDRPKPMAFKAGQKIRVIGGTHCGLEGLFVKSEAGRVVALLNLFGRAVRATIKQEFVA